MSTSLGGEAEITARGVKHGSDVQMQVMATLRCAEVVVGSFGWIGARKMLGLEVSMLQALEAVCGQCVVERV